MEKRKKGTIIQTGDDATDTLRIMCINKILLFDGTIDYSKFDFLFGDKGSRRKRLIKYLISPDCVVDLYRIYDIIFNNCE